MDANARGLIFRQELDVAIMDFCGNVFGPSQFHNSFLKLHFALLPIGACPCASHLEDEPGGALRAELERA
jgi:hypothetical protein